MIKDIKVAVLKTYLHFFRVTHFGRTLTVPSLSPIFFCHITFRQSIHWNIAVKSKSMSMSANCIFFFIFFLLFFNNLSSFPNSLGARLKQFNNWVEFREAKLFLLTISAIRFYATGPEGLPAVIRQIFVGVQRKFRASYISTSFSSPFTAHLHNC